MARWTWMLGGLIVWTVHFMGVYAIASAASAQLPGNSRVSRVANAPCPAEKTMNRAIRS